MKTIKSIKIISNDRSDHKNQYPYSARNYSPIPHGHEFSFKKQATNPISISQTYYDQDDEQEADSVHSSERQECQSSQNQQQNLYYNRRHNNNNKSSREIRNNSKDELSKKMTKKRINNKDCHEKQLPKDSNNNSNAILKEKLSHQQTELQKLERMMAAMKGKEQKQLQEYAKVKDVYSQYEISKENNRRLKDDISELKELMKELLIEKQNIRMMKFYSAHQHRN